MKKKFLVFLFGFIFLFSLVSPGIAFAQVCGEPGLPACPEGTSCVENKKTGISHCQANAQDEENSSGTDPTCEDGKGIDTAIGCISVLDSPEAFLGDILRWAVGVGGGIAFLLIVYASFMIMTSAGNPERLKAGQELLTSAISGLILLIFSVFVLKFIGVDILKLPGLTK